MAQHRISSLSHVIDDEVESLTSVDETRINDRQFIQDLKRLQRLRAFLMQETVSAKEATALSFGRLNLLRYKLNGREPTQAEWADVERHTRTLFGSLTEPLRRRFVLGEIPVWMAVLPILLALVALTALIGATRQLQDSMYLTPVLKAMLPYYLVWLMSLGALGAVAFIGMNALYVQHDITFDVTNRTLMLLRISLGALFGLVLTVPFGFAAFKQFLGRMIFSELGKEWGQPTTETTQALLLVLPFVLGFSASLVIMVLNRLVDAAQAFFGRTGISEPAPTRVRAPKH